MRMHREREAGARAGARYRAHHLANLGDLEAFAAELARYARGVEPARLELGVGLRDELVALVQSRRPFGEGRRQGCHGLAPTGSNVHATLLWMDSTGR